jgi:hypothetical protein
VEAVTAADVASLLAQIAATEAVARAATPGPWCAEHPAGRYGPVGETPGVDVVRHESGLPKIVAHVDPWGGTLDAAHIALNDPARVLARCAADREIVALHVSSPDPDQDGRDFCDGCDHAAPCPTLRALATAYAGPEGERHE